MTATSEAPDDDPQAIVSLRSASFGYADRAVVSEVTLDIHAGEVVAILGPNGSGKSTLVKGLLGLSNRLGGQAALFGTPVDRFRATTAWDTSRSATPCLPPCARPSPRSSRSGDSPTKAGWVARTTRTGESSRSR